MKNILQSVTDNVSTKKGMWTTLSVWVAVLILLSVFAPSVSDYQVTSVDTLPEDAQSVIASQKAEEYFPSSNSLPAILVFDGKDEAIELQDLVAVTENLSNESVNGLEEVIPLGALPPQATDSFFSDNRSVAILPISFDSDLDTPDLKESLNKIQTIVDDNTNLDLYVTGPAGIAVDTTDLFKRADVVLILATVGIILILLIVIYRSPLLALIPLLAAGFVYQATAQILGIFGKAGLLMSMQSISIMTILLFAAVIDYSLFVFSRFREELKSYDSKYEAMKMAMQGTGTPVFYSGGTVFAAMIILIFAELGDYKNFAPIFGTTLLVIMLASITLVPALFTLFGRKSFWPMIPRVNDSKVNTNSFWSKVGRFVTKKPVISVIFISIVLVISASNVLNIKYEFDLLKSFPEDMPSRVGYDILADNFESGDLAPTTVLFESDNPVNETEQTNLLQSLQDQTLVENVRINNKTENQKVISYNLTFEENPYSQEAIDALENILDNSSAIVEDNDLSGEIYVSGETATSVDDRSYNNRDLIVIVVIETILIFIMLIFLTKSFKMPLYMMGTILVSFFAALGLGTYLTELFFGIDTIANRVPVYAFVFLVALGIDYNIMLVSRFIEERKNNSVKKAVEIAVANTGGVISSAGIILAATFAVLMTQPVQMLFVFGFIVAIGILIDTFLVRGVLLPGLLTLFEKEKQKERS
ncbi:MMPL family transporter [Oceanobacillus halophilus]|uniref:MMPL family transporter n=1 Tax=Oceanobacillus halophilus TaxID=930130 RepID=A0A495A1E6_9BACI|nr:MMPL family transporter [Oceanobacillus halophilus]RKQ33288.1 MMPL family transporter [Oceanobacillus halophilus]